MTKPRFNLAELKKIGMIQQKQKTLFALRLRTFGGNFTTTQIRKVTEVADKYGDGNIHMTTRQGIEIHNVDYTNMEIAKDELAEVGIKMGACGPRIRVVTACPGNATCKWGSIETKGLAEKLDNKYFGMETPHKFKISVTGCPHNCAKASENDIGIMGGILPKWNQNKCSGCDLCVNLCPANAIYKEGNTFRLDEDKCIYCSVCTATCPSSGWEVEKQGYIIWIGGTMGKFPRLASQLTDIIEDEKTVLDVVEKTIKYYQSNGRKKERFGHLIDKIGFEKVKKDILK